MGLGAPNSRTALGSPHFSYATAWCNDRNRWCYKARPERLTPRPLQQRLQCTAPLNPIKQTITTLINTSYLIRHLPDQKRVTSVQQYLQRGEVLSAVLVDIQSWKVCSTVVTKDSIFPGQCGSSLLKKNSTRLGQLRESTGEFGRSAQGMPKKLTIKKLRPARYRSTSRSVLLSDESVFTHGFINTTLTVTNFMLLFKEPLYFAHLK